MKLKSLDGFTNTPAPPVDYEEEIRRLRKERGEVQATGETQESQTATEEQVKEGFIRFQDFLARHRGEKKAPQKASDPQVQKALDRYLRVRDFEENRVLQGSRFDLLK